MLAGVFATTASADPHRATRDGLPVAHHVHRAHVLFQGAYDPDNAKPDRSQIEAAQVHRRAILIRHVRRELGAYRDKAKKRWEAARFDASITPYPGPNGSHWAIPYSIVACESGGNFTARNAVSTAGGAYQILDSTWYANGGTHYADSHPAAVAPPSEQHEVAHRVWAASGPGAWSCA